MGQIIKLLASVCQWVCRRSYCRNFYSIFMKFMKLIHQSVNKNCEYNASSKGGNTLTQITKGCHCFVSPGISVCFCYIAYADAVFVLVAKKTTGAAAAAATHKKVVDVDDSSSDFDFGVKRKPTKPTMAKADSKPKAAKPKATKAPKNMALSSENDWSDEESSGKKKTAHAVV